MRPDCLERIGHRVPCSVKPFGILNLTIAEYLGFLTCLADSVSALVHHVDELCRVLSEQGIAQGNLRDIAVVLLERSRDGEHLFVWVHRRQLLVRQAEFVDGISRRSGSALG